MLCFDVRDGDAGGINFQYFTDPLDIELTIGVSDDRKTVFRFNDRSNQSQVEFRRGILPCCGGGAGFAAGGGLGSGSYSGARNCRWVNAFESETVLVLVVSSVEETLGEVSVVRDSGSLIFARDQ